MCDPRPRIRTSRARRRAKDHARVRAEQPAPERTRGFGQLRSTIRDHASGRRADGAPIERVLAETADLAEREVRLGDPSVEPGLLARQVRLWSLDAYLDEPALRNAPRFY